MMDVVVLLLLFLLLILAPAGGYIIFITALQSFKGWDFNHAKRYVDELIKDFIYDRSSFCLAQTFFRPFFLNDVSAYLGDADKDRWIKRFEMTSQQMEGIGLTPYHLPCYWVKLPITSDESCGIYDAMIRDISKEALRLGHCSELRVYIEWSETREKKYKLCRVIYARTAPEQEAFNIYSTSIDKKRLGSELDRVTDPELEESFKTISGGKSDG